LLEELEGFSSKLQQATVNCMDTSKHFGCWFERVKMKQKIDVGGVISFGTTELIFGPQGSSYCGVHSFMIGFLAELTASS
jgi:hypothetical protein